MPYRLLEANREAVTGGSGRGEMVRTVPARVSRIAELAPGALAVADGLRGMTYAQLEKKSNQIARLLIELGVGAESVVALLFDRNVDFVVSALAVMKAGGAYLPLDASNPRARLQAIVDDAKPVVVLTHDAHRDAVAHRRIVNLDQAAWAQLPDGGIEATAGAKNLAYVIYTSGSTGTPKGVEIEHAALSNLVEWHQHAFRVSHSDRGSQTAGLGFDAAVWEIWPYLCKGASVHIAADETRRSPEALREWLLQAGVTIGFAPTVIAEQLIGMEWPQDAKLRVLLTGADTLHRRPVANLPFVLVNNYGPTEYTVVTTSGVVMNNGVGRPSIGRPVLNTKVVIADADLNEVPDGEVGEILIAGAGLARGYRGSAEMTKARFAVHARNGLEERMYRTGDLGRVLPDGEIEFCGRVDDQVKIRGYRVELGDVTTALLNCDGVAQGVTISRELPEGERQLVSYVAALPGARLTDAALREQMGKAVPDYMIPAMFVELASLPLNASGKCDRRALPEATDKNALVRAGAVAPAGGGLESKVAELLAGVLGVNSVGRDDNFFMMGGHSMMAAQLTSRLRETFGVNVSLRQLFGAPTLAGLTALVEKLTGAK